MTEVFATLSGTGDATLAVPGHLDHIGVSVTTIPAGAGVMEATSPKRLMKVGWIAPCRLGSETSWPATVFCGTAKWVDFEREQVSYPAPGPYADRIRYHFEPGAVATLYVNQVVVPAVLNSALMPWDRTPAPIGQSGTGIVVGGGSLVVWLTYTVPTAKRLFLSSASVSLVRTATPSAAGTAVVRFKIGGVLFCEASLGTIVNVGPAKSELQGGGMIVPAATVVELSYQNSDTGGSVMVQGGWGGYLFDA